MKPSPQTKNQQGSNGENLLALTPVRSVENSAPNFRPEAYRLPIKGGDKYFGLTRSWYYQAEKEGLIRLVRIRTRGRLRGITLVPYDDVAALVDAAKQQVSSNDHKGRNA